MAEYISEVVDLNNLDYGSLNLIVSSCGTGKTHFCANTLLDYFPDVLPAEVLFVTSRSIAARQLVEDTDLSEMFDIKDIFLKNAMAGYDDYSLFKDRGIQVTTYDKVIRMIDDSGYDSLSGIKIIIFDEIHSLFYDTFVTDMKVLKLWVSSMIRFNPYHQLFIGLTATPGIVYDSLARWCAPINEVNEPLRKYKAKKLWVVGFKNLPEFIDTHLTDGKTLIMCRGVDKSGCRALLSSIPGSKLLVSMHNFREGSESSYYNPEEMDRIRDCIIKEGELPDDVKVLISTSTIREGFNLWESSGVKNVICCFPDELNITQLAGRCRYNIENLVVACGSYKLSNIDYCNTQSALFRDYIDNGNPEWFNSISHLTDCKIEDVGMFFTDKSSISTKLAEIRRFERKKPEKKKREPKPKKPKVIPYSSREARAEFREYMCRRWISEDYQFGKKAENRKIFAEDKQKIVDKAIELNLFGYKTRDYSFLKLMNAISKDMGFALSRDGKTRIDGIEKRYTIIRMAPKEEKPAASGS